MADSRKGRKGSYKVRKEVFPVRHLRPIPNNTFMHESLTDKLNQLEQKFAAMGQDITSYLEGLLQADYLT